MGNKGKIIAIAKCPPGRAAARLHTFLGQCPNLGADTRVQLTAAVGALDGWVEGATEAKPPQSSSKKRSKSSDTEQEQTPRKKKKQDKSSKKDK
eukprot:CAMPEP_0118922516 /NCGR_PEP_ID=MMETSP1169-20130426/1424_1 /TAXON_ID=36882 /ORGANISM="Pyramimonas obovata, Strain CCMP722" /LENGTH=93 /DNA_ID=CAMNT_0006863405 /DNA_START=44 /DNA_END=325 /DNA_ORIENTATION=+